MICKVYVVHDNIIFWLVGEALSVEIKTVYKIKLMAHWLENKSVVFFFDNYYNLYSDNI